MSYFSLTLAQFPAKFRRIFLPFVIISVTWVGFLIFMYWLLVIRLNVYNLEDNDLVIFGMIVSPWLPMLTWLRKRLKLLNLNTSGRRDPITVIMFLNWATIIIPALIAQSYMSTAIGEVTHLAYLGQIKEYPSTKYYVVDHYYINKNFVHSTKVYAISGKGNTNYDMYFYVCVPVFDSLFPDTNRIATLRKSVDSRILVIINKQVSSMDRLKKLPADSIHFMRYFNPTYDFLTKFGNAGKYGALVVYTRGYKFKNPLPPAKISPVAWLAVKYSKTVSNSLSYIEKQDAFKRFGNSIDTQFKHTDFNHFTYLSQLPNTRLSQYYTKAVIWRGDVVDTVSPVILFPHYARFEDRNGNKLPWAIGSLAIGWALFLVILFFIPLKPGVLPAATKY